MRQTHSPKDRAEQQLGVAQRLVERLGDRRSALVADLAVIEGDLEKAKRRLAYPVAAFGPRGQRSADDEAES